METVSNLVPDERDAKRWTTTVVSQCHLCQLCKSVWCKTMGGWADL